MKFPAYIDGGKLKMSNMVASKFAEDIAKNPKARYEVVRLTPESRNMRGYFEGCIVPLTSFYSDNYDYRSSEDNRKVREWLKGEFLGEDCTLFGKTNKVVPTSKGQLQRLIERSLDWLLENNDVPDEATNPEYYKKWRDEIFGDGEYDTYIDFLISKNILLSNKKVIRVMPWRK